MFPCTICQSLPDWSYEAAFRFIRCRALLLGRRLALVLPLGLLWSFDLPVFSLTSPRDAKSI